MLSNALTMLIQFAFFSLALADETLSTTQHGNAWKYGSGGGVVGFIVLILDILVFLELLKSNRPVSHKLLWSVGVFLFPILGLIVYWLFSNREAHKGSGSYEAIP